MIKAILFDMDGVLLDTERLYMEADKAAAADMGYAFTQEVLHKLCGAGWDLVRDTICGHFGDGFDFDAYVERTRAHMHRFIDGGHVQLKPGLTELLQWMDEHGIHRAVATSAANDMAERMLQETGLYSQFGAVITRSMVQNGKPAPDIFISAATALGRLPGECAAVEDSFLGLRSASAAGCVTIMVPDMLPPSDEIRPFCHAVLPSLAQIPDYLATL